MKIEHIALYVNDLENAKQFFIKYFGAEANDGYHNLRTDFRSYFLTFDDGARLEIMTKPKMEDQAKVLARTGFKSSAAPERQGMGIMRAALSRLREIRLRLRFKRNTLGKIHVV